jgi:hypothetical protein
MHIDMIDYNNIVPVKFYPYTSLTRNRIITINCIDEKLTQFYTSYKKELTDIFNYHEIKAINDNKIVYEVLLDNTTLFIGFYDWIFSIGLSVQSN